MHVVRPTTWVALSVLFAVMLSSLLWPPLLHAQGQARDVAAGKHIYEQRCQRCHGAVGWGDGPKAKELRVPPANFHGPIIKRKTDEQLLTSIEFGIVLSPMHAWRGALSNHEMRDVLAYVRFLGQRGR